jgi:hypothetical protein
VFASAVATVVAVVTDTVAAVTATVAVAIATNMAAVAIAAVATAAAVIFITAVVATAAFAVAIAVATVAVPVPVFGRPIGQLVAARPGRQGKQPHHLRFRVLVRDVRVMLQNLRIQMARPLPDDCLRDSADEGVRDERVPERVQVAR